MDYEAIQKLLQQKSADYGQAQAKFATVEPTLRAQMFGNDPVTQNLNAQERSAIDELFSHDQNVATQYQQNPQLSTSPSGRVLDPYARELATSNRYKGTAQTLTGIRQGQQTRRDVIGDSLQNALKLAQASLDMKRIELEQLEKDRNFAWDVYQFKNPQKTGGGGGGQAVAGDLFNAILGLQEKQAQAAPAKSGKTVTKAKTDKEKSALLARIRAQNPGSQINYTYNKDGTISYSVMKKDQTVLTPEEADPSSIKKLAAAAVASGASSSDVNSILQGLGIDLSKPTRGQQQDTAVQELVSDLAAVPAGMNAQQLYVQLKGAYPEVADSTIKNLMNASGYSIY